MQYAGLWYIYHSYFRPRSFFFPHVISYAHQTFRVYIKIIYTNHPCFTSSTFSPNPGLARSGVPTPGPQWAVACPRPFGVFIGLHDRKSAQYCCCPLTICLNQMSYDIKDPLKPISCQTDHQNFSSSSSSTPCPKRKRNKCPVAEQVSDRNLPMPFWPIPGQQAFTSHTQYETTIWESCVVESGCSI